MKDADARVRRQEPRGLSSAKRIFLLAQMADDEHLERTPQRPLARQGFG